MTRRPRRFSDVLDGPRAEGLELLSLLPGDGAWRESLTIAAELLAVAGTAPDGEALLRPWLRQQARMRHIAEPAATHVAAAVDFVRADWDRLPSYR